MIDRVAYYPGCALEGSSREYDVSTRRVFQALGVELRDIPDWVCCGASSIHGRSVETAVGLPAHALKAASRMGLPLMAPCAMCFSRFRLAALELAHPETRASIEAALGEEIGELPQIVHPIQLLADIPPQARVQLDMKVACYYGCLLVRPPSAGIDDQENPTIMDRVVAGWGATPVPWAFKTECCGAGMSLAHPAAVRRLSSLVLAQARQAGAEVVVVACPMCHANLDMYTDEKDIPVVYITQLVGLALGMTPEELMLDKHFISPLPLLRAKGVVPHG